MPNQNQPAVDVAHDAEPVADQRAGDDQQRDPEQQVDQETLSARLPPAGDRGRQEQPGADPRDADPDDRRLDVHVAQEVERQDVLQRDAVEAAPVVVGVRHDGAGGDLQQQHHRDDEEILADPALAFGERAEARQHRVHRRIVGMVEPELVDEQHEAEGEEGEAEAGPGPDEGVGRRRVADLRLVGPVLGPGPGCVRTARDRGQRRIDQEVAGAQHLVRRQAVGRRPAGIEIGRRQFLRDVVAQRDDGGGQRVGHA